MRLWVESLGLTLVVLALMTATLDDYGMAWDEGYTVECEERIGEWVARIGGDPAAGDRAWSPRTSLLEPRSEYLSRAGLAARSPWSRDSIRFFWPFAREAPTGHPPFFAILGRMGWVISHGFLPPLAAHRFGAAALFAATVGLMYGFLAREYGRPSGAMGALGLLTMPRVFGHAHLASFDVPTMSLGFWTVATFLEASRSATGWRIRTLAFGVALGCAAATKFTAWFLPVPLAAWALLYRDMRAARTLILGSVVAAAVVFVLIPPWWADPIGGLRVFLESNLTRRDHSAIPTQFFGTVYPFSLPWYNTIVLTAIVVPPATLALALAGTARIALGRGEDRVGAMFLIAWAFFMILRALPAAPGHDGERQFMPAFAFLACLAGVGAAAIPALARRIRCGGFAGALSVAVVAGALGSGAWSVWRSHPLQISYYNSLIGGPKGAYRLGLEPTYYWDALTPDARSWLNSHTAPGRSVLFGYLVAPFEYLHRWGLITPPVHPDQTHPPQWYVVQNRPGILRSYPNLKLAERLIGRVRPAYQVGSPGSPEVSLLAIYDIEDAARAEAEMDREDPARRPPTR